MALAESATEKSVSDIGESTEQNCASSSKDHHLQQNMREGVGTQAVAEHDGVDLMPKAVPTVLRSVCIVLVSPTRRP